MRLLNVQSLQFWDFNSGNVPKYGIASHRWHDEVSMKDVLRGRNTDKSGYSKVVQFANYIKTHIPGLEWLWIDTACIDNKSSQEVSEAVNSMFSWYSKAEVCLAYLQDVHTTDEDAFVQSEWFTRGWTLQELLAPRIVVFLNQDWAIIGHKGGHSRRDDDLSFEIGPNLDTAVSLRTSIPEGILRSYDLTKKLNVSQKLAWMSGRRTTREEDMSYSLFGIFDVAIGANYGEGGDKARRRLLKGIAENSTDGPHPATSEQALHLPQTPEVARQRILDSLYFPGLESRRNQIRATYHGTYRWSLLSTSTADVGWVNIVTWLQEPAPEHNIYWISSKPGAGKSSLVRLLDRELDPQAHMEPWSAENGVIRLHYYFWNPGIELQRNMTGLLRTLLFQLFTKQSELISKTVPDHHWRMAQSTREQNITWSAHELHTCLRSALDLASTSNKLLFLIDGLDEISGDEDDRDELLDFIRELSRRRNSKLILSSRRWTVFQDAFNMCPQLRLEDLNYGDIETFVRGEFQSQQRYQQMLVSQPVVAERLILDVVRKAEGVFLWARLVMKALVRGIRDGDSDEMLQQKLFRMPGDLNLYFTSVINSIEEHHRREACILLELAQHQEHEFVTLSPLRLMDLIFVEDAGHDFALRDDLSRYGNIFTSAESLHYALESTLRRISSRCMGLLECYWRPNLRTADSDDSDEDEGFSEPMSTIRSRLSRGTIVSLLHPSIGGELFRNKHLAYDYQVDFMHRSLREFLQEPSIQQFLRSYTGGHFDARNYLRNARLAQVLINMSTGIAPWHSIGLASYHISTLSIPSFQATTSSAAFARKLELTIPYLLQGLHGGERYWYICRSLETWPYEQSNFVTLAIDFALTGYLAQTLSADMVKTKAGRPLLDYALRPRFGGAAQEHTIGNQDPIPELIQQLLHLGADPNQPNEGVSIWSLFLSFCMTTFNHNEKPTPPILWSAYAKTLELLIEAGAHLSVYAAALSAPVDHGLFYSYGTNPTMDRVNLDDLPGVYINEARFRKRWSRLSGDAVVDGSVDVRLLVECFRPAIGDDDTNTLIALVEEKSRARITEVGDEI